MSEQEQAAGRPVIDGMRPPLPPSIGQRTALSSRALAATRLACGVGVPWLARVIQGPNPD